MLRKAGSLSVLALLLLGSGRSLSGTFALQNGIPETSGHLTVQTLRSEPLERKLDFWMTRNGSSTVVQRYDVDMTKLLHFVIVSDDFRTFLHVHPSFAQGHFRLMQRFPRPALYHVYADGEPRGLGQQVFRFDVAVGSPPARVARDLGGCRTLSDSRRRADRPKAERKGFDEVESLGAPEMSANAGPYVVVLSRTRLSNGENRVAIHIRTHGHPAHDLHPYLGALGHVVLLNAKDLTYVHAHPMPLSRGGKRSGTNAMSSDDRMDMHAAPLRAGSTTTPNMLVALTVREPGRYVMWLQFRGGKALRLARFVLTAP